MSSTSGSTSSWRGRAVRRVSAALLVVLIAACATLAPQPPRVLAAEVRVVVFSFPRARLAIDVTLDNRNDYAVAVSALEVGVDVEGARVARAALAAPATLTAHAATVVHLEASADLSMALAGVARALDRGGGPLRYEIAGFATLGGGATYPFMRRGVLTHL
jgi:LEA14-like dessication related protein